jgi:peptidyl-prolyl cis-trans isomerase SurA
MRFWAKSVALFLFMVFSVPSFAQNSDKNIVAEFKGVKITSAEFESSFKKAGTAKKENITDSLAEKRKFLDLYVNYKMKIKDAELKGMLNDPEVINEYNDYKKNIGTNILVEKEILEKGVKSLYERGKFEVRISQVFVKFDSSKADLGYSKAQSILDRIKAGEKFEDLVAASSDDPNAKVSGGDLYWVTSGEIAVPEIENYIYTTDPGKVCDKIFKTQVGFHIIKVTDRQPRIYGVEVSHILTLYKNGNNAPDSLAAMKKIHEAQDEMKKGMSFEDAAKKYSDDKVSVPRGGLLGAISRGRFMREFEEKVFVMKEKEISDIFQTSYGYHIVKVNKILPYPSIAEMEESLKKAYQQTNYQADLEKYIMGLRGEFNYRINSSLYDKLVAVKDSFYVGDSLFTANIRNKYKDSLFVSINGKPFAADSIFNYMVNSGDIIAKRYNQGIIDLAQNRYTTALLLSEKAAKVYSGTPEFEQIMEDYRNGILLFKVSEKEIWNNVKVDTTQIPGYWEQTKKNYQTKPKVTYREIYLTTERMRDSVYTALKGGAGFDLMLKKSDRPNSETPKYQGPEEDELAQKAYDLKNTGDITAPFSYNGGWSIVRLDKKEEKRVKTFEEAKPEVVSALQEKEVKRLEEAYVAKLKDMFNPKIYPENIKN